MTKIVLHPFGEIDAGILRDLTAGVAAAFGLETSICPGLLVPESAFDRSRDQYRAEEYLQLLVDERGETSEAGSEETVVLGVADQDLFVPRLNFVFGVAEQQRGVAVISLHRLRNEYYGKTPDPGLFVERAVKEAIHELGHVFGFTHCGNVSCIMHFSNAIGDTDRKGPGFCRRCASIPTARVKIQES